MPGLDFETLTGGGKVPTVADLEKKFTPAHESRSQYLADLKKFDEDDKSLVGGRR